MSLEALWTEREQLVDEIIKTTPFKDFDDDVSDISDTCNDLLHEITTIPIGDKKTQRKAIRNKKVIYAHQIPVKTQEGLPLTPFKAGQFTIIRIGVIVNDQRWYNEKHLFPKDYASKRSFLSTVNPNSMAIYTSVIEEKDGGPYFVVRADDCTDVFEGKSCATAWNDVAMKASSIRQTKPKSINGIEYYGLTQTLVFYCLCQLPVFHTHVGRGILVAFQQTQFPSHQSRAKAKLVRYLQREWQNNT